MDQLKENLPTYVYDALTNSTLDSLKLIILKSTEELCELTYLKQKDVERVKIEVAKVILKDKFTTALKVPDWQRISTGCNVIDNIIRGGIPVNGINEIVGQSGVGKTQFCIQLALMVQLPKFLGGLEKGVLYICTEDVFPSKRLSQMARFFLLRFPQVTANIKFEDNIFIEHIADYEQLRRLLFVRLENLLITKKVGLIVIDSIAGVFRSETEDVNYVNRTQDFISIVKKLVEVEEKHETAILCVNQVADNPETNKSEPCLGLAWSNLVSCRFQLARCVDGKVRKFEVIFAPDLPTKYCKFIINSDGICGID